MKAGRGALSLLGCLAACSPSADISWHQEEGHRWRELAVRGGNPGYTVMAPDRTGIGFRNDLSDSLALANRILAQGGGVAFADVDGDGRTDLYLCRTDGPNALYLNLGGWRFTEDAAARGVAAADRWSTGAVFADVDGDGDPDLLLNALGDPNALFLNDGTGHFTEHREDVGLGQRTGATTTTLADVDGDGDLDMYIATYKAYTTLDRMSPQERAFDQVVSQISRDSFVVNPRAASEYRLVPRPDLGGVTLVQRADPDLFFLNDGTGRFERVPITSDRFVDPDGRPLPYEPEYFGLAARFGDLDGDGDPDLYVANDFEDPDELWLNDGRGYFRQAPRLALRNLSNSSMAVDFADVDRDGRTDIFVVDMLSRDTRRLKTQTPTHTALPKLPGDIDNRPQLQRNTLFLNRGDGTWAEAAALAAVEASGWSWSSLFTDVDLDGWEDLLIGTGHKWDLMDSDISLRLRNRLVGLDWRMTLTAFPPLALPNMVFRNRGDSTFEDATKAWRFAPEDDISHGMALADLDDDGDLDVVVNRLNAPALVLRNDARAPRVAVRLRGDSPNTDGIGAMVRILGGAVPLQVREVMSGGLYLSGSDPLLSFGTGRADSVTIEVRWPDGRQSRIDGTRPGRLYEISQTRATSAEATDPSLRTALFEDRSDLLRHTPGEALFNEYNRQLMLPNGLGQLGPGVAWLDVDRDGDPDLLLGAGREGQLTLYRNEPGGRLTGPLFLSSPARGDLTGLAGLPTLDGGLRILAGLSNYEEPDAAGILSVPSVIAFDPGRTGQAGDSLVPPDTASTGPLALADVDRDGDLDLFVGGRVIPGGWPLTPQSRLFRNDGRRFVLDPAATAALGRQGMVSAAVFSDLDGDGDPDLLLALEWGPLKLFLNDGRGGFTRAPESWGLDRWYSRWNGVATGDLDGDGRLDIVATSWGRNVEDQADSLAPLFVYFGQFGTRSGVDVLLARHDSRIGAIAPRASFGRLGTAVPEIAERLRTYGAYADASIEQVLGPAAPRVQRLGANTLDHMVFMNRGNRFEARSLPAESQLTPALYAGIADFDGDGREDVVLGQNFFATGIGTPRYDGGRGLLLLGDGAGGLRPVPGQESGILVYGEQRGAGYADYDGDGRLDLVITQNSAPTVLLHNTGARPGLRVRLVGPAGNPDAIGALVRVVYGTGDAARRGPVREVQAGSGYWSQNGAVQVMGLDWTPAGVWVRWPDGTEAVELVPAGASEIVVRK